MKRQRMMRKGTRAGAMKLEQLERRQLLSAALDGGILRILTGTASDSIFITRDGDSLKVQENGVTTSFDAAGISRIQVGTGSGNDLVQASDIAIPIEAHLGSGADSLFSGSGSDTVYGGGNGDLIVTGDGADVVYGEGGDDRIMTGAGNDTITGGSGNDAINTGSGTDTTYGTTKDVDKGKGSLYSPMSLFTYQPDAFLSNVSGYDPNQVRKAYGFAELDDLQTLDWEALPGLALAFKRGRELDEAEMAMLQTAWKYGYGQTIYIVDAYTGLNITNDFNVFNDQFGLPRVVEGQNFRIVNANRRAPAVDANWAGEIMLDLEWAHAIAPAANIVLVQADSNVSIDVYHAVKKAADMAQKAGGGVVSMSLGRDYIYDQGVDGYDATTTGDQILWDNLFRARTKVTFVAASGDSGSIAVASWPAMSPYVTAVGGTSLSIDQDGNRMGEEAAWFNGGSGYGLPDWYERPTYQDGIDFIDPIDPYDPAMTIPVPQDVRGIPDVSYNGDPATPFAVYTTTPLGGDRGWFAVGGTSAGTPQWAALIALANAKRQSARLAPIGNRLNGALYDIYNGFAGEAAAGQEYEDCFNDIILGTAGPWPTTFRYDMATGIGTPRADALINTLGDYTGFFIQKTFNFEARLFMPFSVASAGRLPVGSGQLHTGTGTMVGGDQLHLLFTTDPVRRIGPGFTDVAVTDRYFDLEEGQLSDFRVQLQRTGRGQSRGRIYGTGAAEIQNADTNVPQFPVAAFTLKFDGTWWTGKDGQIHFHVEFRAVDPVTYEPLESRPAALVFNSGLPWLGGYYAGELNG